MVFHESLNPERKFSLVTPLVFIAILAGTTGVVEVANSFSSASSYTAGPQAQLAQSAAPTSGGTPADGNDGICGKEYTKCIDPAKKNDPERCELQWRSCIKNRCVKTDTKTADSCLKDPDCVDACTELTAANGDLKNCCSVIKRGNDCKTAIESVKVGEAPMCNPDKTKLPGGGTGTGGDLTPAEIEDMQKGIDANKNLVKDLETQKALANDPSGEYLWTPQQETELNQLKQDLAKQESAYEQIMKTGGDSVTLTDEGVGTQPRLTDEGVGANSAFDKNAVRLTPEQAAEYAKLSDAFGPGSDEYAKLADAFGPPDDTFGPAATPEELKRAELAETIRSDQAAWAGANNQAALEETIRSDQAAWAAADKQAALEETIRSDQAAWDAANKQAALEETIRSDQAAWAEADKQAALEETIRSDQAAWDEANRQVALDRDARIAELKREEESMNAIGGMSPESRAELERLEAEKAAAEGDAAKTRGLGTPAAAPKKDEGIVSGTDQPGVDCSKGGCIDAKGNPIPATTPAPKPEVKKGDGTPDAKPEVKTPRVPATPDGNQTQGPGAKQGQGAGPGTGGEKPAGGGGGGNPMGAIGSFLDGLMKALTAPKPPAPAPAQACSTDPNVYAQQQQQYQQQLQQYNYQLQQQQYQKQLGQYYADRNGITPPPDLPFPQQPTPCSPSVGNQCREQIPQPNPNNCTVGYWQAAYSGACITGWQCIPRTGTTTAPVATLSCEPEVADVGMPIAITYGCSSGTATSSSFLVTTQPGGSAMATVANPPAGTNTATYSLACVDQGKTSGAQCSVQVSRPTIILVANPSTVTASSTSATSSISLISWLTTGMDSCVISSPDMPGFTLQNMSNTSMNGAATTSPLTSAARVHLDCLTAAGSVRGATTTVHVAGVPDDFTGDLVEASSTIDRMTVPLDATTTIKWRTINAPLGSAMSLWVLDVQSGQPAGLIAGGKPVSGTYVWQIPNAGDACPANTPYVCAADLVSGREYLIEADLYTPPDADLGEPGTPASAPDPLYLEFGFTNSFTMQ